MHCLVAFRDFGEGLGFREARIDLAVEHQLIERVRLLVVGEVRRASVAARPVVHAGQDVILQLRAPFELHDLFA